MTITIYKTHNMTYLKLDEFFNFLDNGCKF